MGVIECRSTSRSIQRGRFQLNQAKGAVSKVCYVEAPGLVVRMEAKEAEVYGEAVLDLLLSRARKTLVTKYKAELREPVYIEIFDRQSDFAIRTFVCPVVQVTSAFALGI